MQNHLVSEVKLTYKSIVKPSERAKIKRSEDTYNIFINNNDFMEDIEFKEKFFMLVLNRGLGVLSISKLSEGTTIGTVVDIKHVMQTAILQNADSIILAHNHPSGTLKASVEDISLTKKIKEAAKLFDIKVSDHLIITSESYLSFADECLI